MRRMVIVELSLATYQKKTTQKKQTAFPALESTTAFAKNNECCHSVLNSTLKAVNTAAAAGTSLGRE